MTADPKQTTKQINFLAVKLTLDYLTNDKDQNLLLTPMTLCILIFYVYVSKKHCV